MAKHLQRHGVIRRDSQGILCRSPRRAQVASAREGFDQQFMLKGARRIKHDCSLQLSDGLRGAPVLLEPAAVIGMYRIVGGREEDRSLKMLLCFSGPRSVSLVGQLAIDDPQVDLKAGIVGREDKGAAEVVERG